MGYETACDAVVNGKVTAGRVLFETSEIIFRGAVRLKIPLQEIVSAEARGGKLLIRYSGGAVQFQIGAQADKWLQKIRNPKTRLDKLGIKAGLAICIVNVADNSLWQELEAQNIGAAKRLKSESDIILYGIESRKALSAISKVKQYLRPTGALWVIRPKGTPAITESEVMAAGKAAGLVDIKVASFSSTHTAEKFVVPVRDR